MVTFLQYLTEGSRVFFTSWKNRISPRKYEGNAKQICEAIVKDCWNEQFLQTSTTNFPQFWTRDLGWCTSSLLKIKYDKEVQQTIRYALNRFKKHKKVTTTITPKGKPFNFPVEAIDSLPWLIHSIKLSEFHYYSYKDFLNKEINKFFKKFIDSSTGLVKPDLHVSSMKDFAIRKSSCYDNCMVAMLASDLSKMKRLNNPFSKYDYSAIIKRHFWNGHYFYDDLTKKDYVAGDANLFPFLLGIINDKQMLESALDQIRKSMLDLPLPLKYTEARDGIRFIPQEIFFRNYESDSVWTHMGLLYIKLVSSVDKDLAKHYKQLYTEKIEELAGFPEVLDKKGKPFSTPFYYCDRGMLWAANYLSL